MGHEPISNYMYKVIWIIVFVPSFDSMFWCAVRFESCLVFYRGLMLNLYISLCILNGSYGWSMPIAGTYFVYHAFLPVFMALYLIGEITYTWCESVGALSYIIISVFGKYLCKFCMGRAIAVKRCFSCWSPCFKVNWSFGLYISDLCFSYISLNIACVALKLIEGWKVTATFHKQTQCSWFNCNKREVHSC